MVKTRGLILLLASLAVLGQKPRDLRADLDRTALTSAAKGNRFALVIGISRHLHLPPAAQLRFAHRDAEDFATFLRSEAGGALPPSRLVVLTNEKATLAAIRAALHNWLVDSAGPDDTVYVFFAGHGVVAERDEAYFVAHDSDPQNLHATALSFEEVDRTLSERLRAGLTVLALDACHSGKLGWTTHSIAEPSRLSEPAAALGRSDRSFLKLLASRPSERSFEDERWDGGHGVFTYSMLQGLRGRADGDNDGVVRASELVDYMSRIVPDQTEAKQHPRVAGTFDARLAMATVPQSSAPTQPKAIEPRAAALEHLEERVVAGQILEPNGAWDFYQAQNFTGLWKSAATAVLSAALEDLGQTCVSDYVQSTEIGPKKAMLNRAAQAYERLRILRPGDTDVESRSLFCQGRSQIAEGQYEAALSTLRKSLQLNKNFACAYNAMGVALERLNRPEESLQAFETAARLTPEWALPPLQIASHLMAKGQVRQAVSYLEQSSRANPRAVVPRWQLMHAHRLIGNLVDVENTGAELIRLNPAYAPAYLELGRAYEAAGDRAKAAAAFETYVLLAPNYADSDEIRGRIQQHKAPPAKPLPTLRRPGDK